MLVVLLDEQVEINEKLREDNEQLEEEQRKLLVVLETKEAELEEAY